MNESNVITSTKDCYARFHGISVRERNGITELRIHSRDGPAKWSLRAHLELGQALAVLTRDPRVRAVILTGTGDAFIRERYYAHDFFSKASAEEVSGKSMDAISWDVVQTGVIRLIDRLLDIPVPIIAAVNGPAFIHAELPLLCDIVLASSTAEFQNRHYQDGLVAGDGSHVVWPLLLGVNRAQYFLLTGQIISVDEALRLGVVSEILPQDLLLERAWELAEEIAAQPPLTTKYARALFTRPLKKVLADELPYGLALQGLAASISWLDHRTLLARPA